MSHKSNASRWGTYQDARRHSGLSIRLLQDYVRANLVRSSLVRKPGAKRGVRLLDLASLDEFIERGVGASCQLAFNDSVRVSKSPRVTQDVP